MANARGSVGARGLCHRSAGPPGLSISESDPESATVSRERRLVNMAAREVGQVVNDELAALRLQVASLQQLVELVFAKVYVCSNCTCAGCPATPVYGCSPRG